MLDMVSQLLELKSEGLTKQSDTPLLVVLPMPKLSLSTSTLLTVSALPMYVLD